MGPKTIFRRSDAILLILLITQGCGVRVRDLPFREYPVVTDFACLAGVEEREEDLILSHFPKTPSFPMFLYFRLNDVEGQGNLRLLLYDEQGEQVRQNLFSYGKPEIFYEHITVYQRYADLPEGSYTVAIFWGEELVFRKALRVGG
jgi:hypothetical protein